MMEIFRRGFQPKRLFAGILGGGPDTTYNFHVGKIHPPSEAQKILDEPPELEVRLEEMSWISFLGA